MIVKLAMDAIDKVFSDTSVPVSVTRERLIQLRENIDNALETLNEVEEFEENDS